MTPRAKNPPATSENATAPATDHIREQLKRILESPQFRNSRRCSAFLRHVVEAAADGRLDSVKERNLGVAIFERTPDYDTNQDPIVRNTAGQVRKRLAQYYYAPGHESELRIDLPPGAYVPEISAAAGAMAAAAGPALDLPTAPLAESPVQPVPPLPPRKWKQRAAVGAAALTAAIAAVVLLSWRQPQPSNLQAFWGPVLKFPSPITVCVGQGHVYKLNEDWDRYFEAQAGQRAESPLPNPSVPIGTVVPSWDRHIGLSDAQVAMRLAALFGRFGKETVLRGGRSTTLSDLRRKPAVLVGAFNNEWTLRLTGELRFYFDTEDGQFFVRDRLRPDNHAWRVETDAENLQVQTDYAIVSRVHNPTTEQSVIVAGGIKGAGTYAAGEFLTNSAYINEALKNAPSGWEHRNAQFVLSTKVYSGTPGPPQVVASHYW